MSYVEHHIFADSELEIPLTETPDGFHELIVNASGHFNIRFPGKLFITREATFLVRTEPLPENPATEGQPRGERPTITSTPIPLNLVIRAPDGRPFTKDEVTLEDLRKYRDLRGETKGFWSYTLWGRSGRYPSDPRSPIKAFPGTGRFKVVLVENVPSKSAPPLVYEEIAAGGGKRFTFDLYRVGTFTATAQPPRPMKLIDPAGTTVATSETGELSFPVTLPMLDRSRDEKGKPRLWSLDLREESPTPNSPTSVWASVIETARVRTELIKRRLDTLIGEQGGKIEIYGRDQNEVVRLLLKVNDPVTAGTLDMFGLLDFALFGTSGEGGHHHVDLNREYILGTAERFFTVEAGPLSATFNVSAGSVRVGKIEVSFGASDVLHQPSPFAPPIGPPVPAMKVRLEVAGEATVRLGTFTVATITAGAIPIEAGIRLNPDGTLAGEAWTTSKPIDIDISVGAAVTAGLLSPALLGVAVAKIESLEGDYNDKIVDGITTFFKDLLKSAPRFFAVLLGDAFSYTSFRPEATDFVLDYVAPIEPDPRASRDYKAIIGRSVTELGPRADVIRPRTLGNTWEAGNLAEKIDHIFVVMMENRSFDHVLGYLAATPAGGDSDGLSPHIVRAMTAHGEVRALRDIQELEENEVHLRTQLQEHVGHGLRDVREQIAHTISAPATPEEGAEGRGRAILSPQGFISNFSRHQARDSKVKTTDIMGYYTDRDLPFFDFLVKNYSWCERYFCSHAGPTLPNRMFWLSGDVQYDRTGEAILDNNKSYNFFLSRALNIFDVLTRKGISWRVYESEPSVAMLRMYARYSTDKTNIVRYSPERLRDDVMQGDVPSVVFVEPAMHHFPPADDHPPADMYRGQLFLKDVYDAVTSNQEIWQRSMLIITYDEHGGFYDHVIPPIAEIRTTRLTLEGDPGIGREEPGLAPTGEGGGRPVGGSGPRGRFAVVRELAEAVRAGEAEVPGTVVVGPLGGGLRPGEVRGEVGEVFEGEGFTPTPIEGRDKLVTHYGVRVPTFVVSPWVMPGKGPDIVLDHCSILKTILARFLGDQKPFMSDRVHSSHTFNAWLAAEQPRLNIASPELERLEEHAHRRPADPIVTSPVFRRQMLQGNVDYHDLTGMVARLIRPEPE